MSEKEDMADRIRDQIEADKGVTRGRMSGPADPGTTHSGQQRPKNQP